MGSILKVKNSDTFEKTTKKLIEDHPTYREMMAAEAAQAQESRDLFAEDDDLNQAFSQSRWDLVEALVTDSPSANVPAKKSAIEIELSRCIFGLFKEVISIFHCYLAICNCFWTYFNHYLDIF
jgi:hypothetical protein